MSARLPNRLAAGLLLGSALVMSSGAHATGVTNGSPPRAAEETPEPESPKPDCYSDQDSDSDAGTLPGGNQRVYPDDLEIDNMVVGTRKDSLVVYVRFARFNEVPAVQNAALHNGPRVDASFQIHNTRIRLIWGSPNQNWRSLATARNQAVEFPFAVTSPSVGFEAPTRQSDWVGAVKGTEPLTNKTYVKLWIPLATLSDYSGVDVTPGTVIQDVQAYAKLMNTSSLFQNDGNTFASNATWRDNDVEIDRSPEGTNSGSSADPAIDYTVGTDPTSCFPISPTRLSALAGTTVAYGDVANLSAKLTYEGTTTPLADKEISFTAAGKTVKDRTDDNGIARAGLAHGRTAGTYTLTVRFAGDTDGLAKTMTGTLTVVREKTSFTSVTVTRSGSSRTVTATLKDNDGKAVTGVPVRWSVNGRLAPQASTTNSNGQAVFRGGRPGDSVYAQLLLVKDKYDPAKSRSVRL